MTPPIPAASVPPSPPPMPPSLSLAQGSKITLRVTSTLVPTETVIHLEPVVILSAPEDTCPELAGSSDSGSDSDSASSSSSTVFKSIQDKIGVFGPPASSSKHFKKRTDSEKRKHSESPDKTELTRAEKKNIKKHKKKVKKLEYNRAEQLKAI